MTELILFHHAQGLTDGVRAFADELRADGHVVHVPDLYEGRTFTDLTDGVRYAEEEVGFATIIERGRLVAERLPNEIVYAGFSLGVLPAQTLAQTRPGAR
jgi:dienelactone hydrolase